jgi:hypothetical protein
MSWISVNDRLPKRYITVLAWAKFSNGDEIAGRAYLRTESKILWSFEDDSDTSDGPEVSHWMPMPNGPEVNAE